jgi:hypothetical protein
MSVARRLSLPIVVIAIATLIVSIFSSNRVALSYPDARQPIGRWVYNTATVESGNLAARLDEFGRNGWEVFSVHPTSQVLEQDQDLQTRLVVERYQITSRKPTGRQ